MFLNKKTIFIGAALGLAIWVGTMPHGLGGVAQLIEVGAPTEFSDTTASRHPARVELAIVRTSWVMVPEALVVAEGSLSRQVQSAYSGFLIRHGDTLIAFDLGLGSQIDAQYAASMRYWQRPFFKYEKPVVPIARQIAGHGLPALSDVLISHAHWDHLGGLEDFPQARVWLSAEERDNLRHPGAGPGHPWAAQSNDKNTPWRLLRLDGASYRGYAHSHDLFGDGSVVAVAMPGHTPGSIGLFVTVSSGQEYFLVGDTIWNAAALRGGRPKFWLSSWLVDQDTEATAAHARQLAELARDHPALTIIPTHDGDLQQRLGLFPQWLH